jgi:outer membrane immunogenic protein
MKAVSTFVMLVVAIAACATRAEAQSWTGLYVGGSAGGGFLKKQPSETVLFDTNLDGVFTDTVRTSGGANAFSPGFCGGTAINATAAAGCTEDETTGLDFSGRLGYDKQAGRLVIGVLVDAGRTDLTDAVTAFSVTPAFYTFTREVKNLAGMRARLGLASGSALIYATGGAASASIEHTFTTSNAVNTFVRADSPSRAWGYQAGGGVEIKVGARISLTGEYLWTSLNDREDGTVRSQGPAPATNPFILVNAGGTDLQRSARFEFHSARAGINFRF